jgi:hypothetical protein
MDRGRQIRRKGEMDGRIYFVREIKVGSKRERKRKLKKDRKKLEIKIHCKIKFNYIQVTENEIFWSLKFPMSSNWI